jgi:hypothetical protein
MARARNALGQFAGGGGGGGGGAAGGVFASVELDTTGITPALQQLQQATNQAGASIQQLGAQGVTATKGVAGFGSQLLLVGQFADDVQYGLRAVVNQIPQLVGAFGGGAGLAGAIGIVAVAANQLVNHWDQLIDKFTTRGPETAAQEMQRLANNTAKTADEQKRLNDLKREEQQIEAQRRRPTAGAAKENKAAGEAIQESPYDLLLRDVGSALMDRDQGMIERRVQQRQAQIEALTPGRKLTDEAVNALRTKYRNERAPKVVSEAEDLIRTAENGSNAATQEQRDLDAASARSKLQALATKYPGLKGLEKFSGQLESDKEVKALMYESEQNYKANEERLRLEASGESRPDLEKLYQQGLAEKHEDEARAKALDVGEQAGLDRVKAHAEAVEEERARRAERSEARGTPEEHKQLRDTENELLYNRYQLMNPNRQGQTMGLDQYEASIKSQTGETEESKQLKELVDLNKRILEVQQKRRGLMVRTG